jgi:uncharacterized membrane protein YphA (DoxX/SURF4 family)
MHSNSATLPVNTLLVAPTQAADVAVGGLDRSLRWFRAALGLCYLASLLLSYKAWLSSGRHYPLVPAVDGLPQPPFPVDWLLLGAMTAALLGMSFARRPRPYMVVVLAITGVWMLLDQTRWQPYIQTYVLGTVCLLLGEMSSVRAASASPGRWHIAPLQLGLSAMWAYAGLHKLNVAYPERYFPRMVGPALVRLGVEAGDAARMLYWPAVASAVLEMTCGLALLWPRTRRLGVLGLTGMHLFLLLLLGPLGYSYNRVVWPWNVVVLAALWLLFWPRAAGDRFDAFMRAGWRRLRGRGGEPAPRPVRLVWRGVILFFVLLPLLSFVHMWDALLSFHLYSGKERVAWIEYPPAQRAALPAAVVATERRPGQIDFIRWSMREMDVYPVLETRVATRVAQKFARTVPDVELRLVLGGEPAVLTGKREFRTFLFRGPDKVPVEVPTTGVPRGGVHP